MDFNTRTNSLREESGTVTYSDPLTTFFYLLLRNETAAGVVEQLVHEATSVEEEIIFANGWLAKYANNLADQIKNAKSEHLKNAMEAVFNREDDLRSQKAAQEERESYGVSAKQDVPEASLEDEILEHLQKKIIKTETSKTAHIEENYDEDEDDITTLQDAMEMVEKLKKEGQITGEDAERLQEELDEVKEETDLQDEDVGVVKNGVVVSDNIGWRKEHVTYVDVKGEATKEGIEKWQKTNEELQKLDEEESATEEE